MELQDHARDKPICSHVWLRHLDIRKAMEAVKCEERAEWMLPSGDQPLKSQSFGDPCSDAVMLRSLHNILSVHSGTCLVLDDYAVKCDY